MELSLISRRAFLLSAAASQTFALFADDGASPIVEVPKPLFARGEQIRIWVGINTPRPIPQEKQLPGVLHITRPDGVLETRPVSWPIDGPAGLGWKGGVTLDNATVILGQYRFSFEWDRKQSPQAELTVGEWDLEGRIAARWVFAGDNFQQATAELIVENRSDRILRFCRLGMPGADVWLSCKQDGPAPSQQSLFYPWKELWPAAGTDPSGDIAEEASWQNFDRLPLITVEPQNRFSQILFMSKLELQFAVTTPEVEIGAELTVFIGEPGDVGSEIYPVRLEIRASRKFTCHTAQGHTAQGHADIVGKDFDLNPRARRVLLKRSNLQLLTAGLSG